MDKLTTDIVKRPWGEERWFNTSDPISKVKIITVNKGESLSLQYHHKRSEFWKILSGSAKVEIGDKTFMAQTNDEFYIEVKTNHRISAPDNNCTFLEVATGIFDQEDIVRLEDKYGRVQS
jgi:mannose-6-phosphate isomerase-like protein (cupin superfamily)